jgi:proteasome lid subunit RPN8/RPN11
MMHYEIRISQQDFTRLHEHAENGLPHEVVALLFGIISEYTIQVNRVEFVKNESKNSHTAFSINPEIEYQLLIEADELGEALVGIYHSHPAPPAPSETDLRNMRLNPVIWLISSKLTGEWETQAYILVGDDVHEVSINKLQSNVSRL